MQIDLRRAHRRMWPILALVLLAGFLAALLLRPTLPVETTPVPSFKGSADPRTGRTG